MFDRDRVIDLTLEQAASPTDLDRLWRQNLQRHPATQRQVLGFVYRSHPALVEQGEYPDVSDLGVDERVRSG